MTNKEAAIWLREHIDATPDGTKQSEAIEMAIKALEQEPCEDCISRQEAIDAVNNLTYPSSLVDVKRKLVDLPSVTQQQYSENWKFYYDHGYAQAKRDLFCDDCISRAEALRHSHIEYDNDGEGHRVVYFEDIENLPSVTPTSDAEGDYESGYNCGYADAIDDMA